MLTSVQREHTIVVFMPRAITPRGHSTVLANEVFMVMDTTVQVNGLLHIIEFSTSVYEFLALLLVQTHRLSANTQAFWLIRKLNVMPSTAKSDFFPKRMGKNYVQLITMAIRRMIGSCFDAYYFRSTDVS